MTTVGEPTPARVGDRAAQTAAGEERPFRIVVVGGGMAGLGAARVLEAARAQGVPTNRRNVFLDNERKPEAIRRQLDEAVYRCRMDGEAIAIGHLDPVTVEVLAAELPGIAAKGADLVKPSDLVR